MSCIVKTVTPFIDKEILCAALKEYGCECTIQGEKIITNIKDVLIGFQTFERDYRTGRFVLNAYSHTDRNRAEFVNQIEKYYNILYQKRLEEIELARQKAIAEAEKKRLEEEKKRLEEERKAFVEKQKNTIITRAEEKGYYVKEEKVNNKIKLVLVKRTY